MEALTRLLKFNDKDFWKGALVGAAVMLVLNNQKVQNVIFNKKDATPSVGDEAETESV